MTRVQILTAAQVEVAITPHPALASCGERAPTHRQGQAARRAAAPPQVDAAGRGA